MSNLVWICMRTAASGGDAGSPEAAGNAVVMNLMTRSSTGHHFGLSERDRVDDCRQLWDARDFQRRSHQM